jgi:hypothetical protein
MKALIKWLRKIFVHETGYSAVEEIFAPIDPAAVCRSLDVDGHARQAGKQELPATDAKSMDATETRIVHLFQEDVQTTARGVSDKLQIYRRQLERQDIEDDLQAITGMREKFDAGSLSMIEESRDQLEPAIALRTELRSDLAAFKDHHEINRAPDYPESKFVYFAVLFAIFVTESVLNAFFFAAGSDFGLLGGWIDAVRYAGINIAISFLIGLALMRQLNHKSWSRRAAGAAGVVILLVLVPVFNFFVGHYREIFAVDPDNAQTTAVRAFLDNPVGLATVESWLLFAVGSVFAAIAAYEGYAIEDPYPGYGRLARRIQRAEEDYLEEKQEIKQRLSYLREATIDALDKLRDKIVRKQDELLDLSGLADTIRSKFDMHLALLKKSCNVVLSRYREINTRARSTEPPQYFGEECDITTTLKLDLPSTISFEQVQDRKSTISGMLKTAETQRSAVETAYVDYLRQLDDAIQQFETGRQ